MLLTLPWLGSLILGRVDIVDGVGVDGTTSKFTINSFLNQVCLNSSLKKLQLLSNIILASKWSERNTLRGNTTENQGYCLFIYVCGRTYVIMYFDPHIFVFASWSTPSHISTKQNFQFSDPVSFMEINNITYPNVLDCF